MRRSLACALLALSSGCGEVALAPPDTTTTISTGCPAGYADCAHDGTCATALGTAADCGACGDVCASIHGAASCVAGACALACDAGFTDCNGLGGDGCEAELAVDARHCGACGVDCGTWGDCLGGSCVQVLASAPAFAVGADALWIDGADLYWSAAGLDAEGMIGKVPLAGGATVTLAHDDQYADCLHGNGVTLAWNDWGVPGVYTMPKTGGPVETLWSPPAGERPQVLEMDASYVYLSTGTALSAVPLAGGSVLALGGGFTNLVAARLDDGWLYVADSGPIVEQTFDGHVIDGRPEGSILRLSLTTGERQLLAQHLDSPSDLVLAGGALYWAEGGSMATYDVEGQLMNLGSLGRVVRANPDGGNPTPIADGVVHPVALAADATHLYWGCAGTGGGADPANTVFIANGSLMRAALAGGAVETVMPSIDVMRVALSSDAVVFSSYLRGLIVKKAKP
jgi:hypothetical protein